MNWYSDIGIVCLLFCIISPIYADISVLPVYSVGDEIIIGGNTNYNTDNKVLIEIWPASFGPKGKYESSMTGGGSGVVPVVSTNGTYSWNLSFNSAEWMPDSYMVRTEVIGKGYVETVMFDLTEEKMETGNTPVPTIIQSGSETVEENNTLVPTLTTIPETNITTPSPVETQKSPISGFCVLLSLVLGATMVFIMKNRQ